MSPNIHKFSTKVVDHFVSLTFLVFIRILHRKVSFIKVPVRWKLLKNGQIHEITLE